MGMLIGTTTGNASEWTIGAAELESVDKRRDVRRDARNAVHVLLGHLPLNRSSGAMRPHEREELRGRAVEL